MLVFIQPPEHCITPTVVPILSLQLELQNFTSCDLFSFPEFSNEKISNASLLYARYGSLVSFFNKFLTQPSSYDTSTYNVIVPSGARTTSSSRIYRYEFIRNNASLRVPVQRLKMTISQIDQSLGGTIILVTLWQSVNIKACIDNSNC